ncbi:MAG: S8 family serine peptidase, partial [Bacteroidota bacterium]
MPDQLEQFKHISLQLTKQGIASPGGYPRPSSRSVTNKGNRDGHGRSLQNSVSSIVSSWQSELDRRQKEGLPDTPALPSFLLQVDPDSFDADSLRGFDIEVVLELEDGYILGASSDAELTQLQEKIEKFIAEERGGGKIAEIWQILEGQFERLEYILSPDLLARWDQILDDHSYILDVSIACVGLTQNFPNFPPKKEDEEPETYANRVARWTDKRNQTIEEWDQLQLNREDDFENFVRGLGGHCLLLGDRDDRSHLALLPDSFSGRIEISGKGLKDLAANYPYVFEISEPEQTSESLANRTTTATERPSFTLSPPSATAPKVCIIDSGIQESHRFLRAAMDTESSISWVPGEEHQKADYVSGGGHGTRVAGAVLYPQGIPWEAEGETAICWIQNARVLDRDCYLPTDLYLPDILNRIVDIYYRQHGTRIFNQSITSKSPCRKIYMSAWAAEID